MSLPPGHVFSCQHPLYLALAHTPLPDHTPSLTTGMFFPFRLQHPELSHYPYKHTFHVHWFWNHIADIYLTQKFPQLLLISDDPCYTASHTLWGCPEALSFHRWPTPTSKPSSPCLGSDTAYLAAISKKTLLIQLKAPVSQTRPPFHVCGLFP